MTEVSVSDPLVPDCQRQFDELGEGRAISYWCEVLGVTESFTNTAAVEALDPTGAIVSSGSNTAVVKVGYGLFLPLVSRE